MKRRTLLGGLVVAGAAGALWARPRDRGVPHDEYFSRLNQELRAHGPATPCLVLDLDRLDANTDTLIAELHPGKAYRLVAKSLPSTTLIRHVLERTGSRRIMGFHQPFLNLLAREFPGSDLLLGKPMPARAADSFYQQHRGDFDPAMQLQWLVDSPQRLSEYLALARGRELRLRINVEIDVGLRRGGVADDDTMARMAEMIASNPQQLEFAGLMGYDPHVVHLPSVFGGVDAMQAKAINRYRARIAAIRAHRPALLEAPEITWNGAGSPNYSLHREQSPLNEVAVGSALVKPSDFDLPTLDAHQPALFIAAPVLKRIDGTHIPELERASGMFAAWNPNRQRSHFIYGGRWMADPHSPSGLIPNDLYGRSSNQDLLNGSRATALEVDDHVFLRPTQSEALMLQFGDLVVVRGGRIVDRWPVFPTLS
jgi:D-serine deaminase-like pyridoxal phosphate-dependent protein